MAQIATVILASIRQAVKQHEGVASVHLVCLGVQNVC